MTQDPWLIHTDRVTVPREIHCFFLALWAPKDKSHLFPMNDERRQVRHTRTTQADVCILVAKPHPAPEVCSEVGVDVGVEGGRKCPSVQIELCCDFPPREPPPPSISPQQDSTYENNHSTLIRQCVKAEPTATTCYAWMLTTHNVTV